MPYRTRRAYRKKAPFKRRATKRTYKRAARRPRATTRSRRYLDPARLPRRLKLVYRDVDVNLDVVASLYQSTHVFRGNSLYDPDVTSVGHQPLGYDQLFPAMYNSYHVTASSIKVFLSSNESVTESGPIRCMLIPSALNTLPTADPLELLGMRGCKVLTLQPTAGKRNVLSSYLTTNTVLGRPTGNDFQAESIYSANPILSWYWHVIVDNTKWSSPAAVRADVQITYYVNASHANLIPPS